MSQKSIAILPKKRKTSEMDLESTVPSVSSVYRPSPAAAFRPASPEPPIDLDDYRGHRVLAFVSTQQRYRRSVIEASLHRRHLQVKFHDARLFATVIRDVLDHAITDSAANPPPVISDHSPCGQQVALGELVAAAVEGDERSSYRVGRVEELVDRQPTMYRVRWPDEEPDNPGSCTWVRRTHVRLLRAPWHDDLADALSAARGNAPPAARGNAPPAARGNALPVASPVSPSRATSAGANSSKGANAPNAAVERACELEIASITAARCTTSPTQVHPPPPPPPPAAPPLLPNTPSALATPPGGVFPASMVADYMSFATPEITANKESPLASLGGSGAGLSRCVSAQSVESLASSSASQSPSLLYLTRDGITLAPGSTPKYKKGDVVCTPKGRVACVVFIQFMS